MHQTNQTGFLKAHICVTTKDNKKNKMVWLGLIHFSYFELTANYANFLCDTFLFNSHVETQLFWVYKNKDN